MEDTVNRRLGIAETEQSGVSAHPRGGLAQRGRVVLAGQPTLPAAPFNQGLAQADHSGGGRQGKTPQGAVRMKKFMGLFTQGPPPRIGRIGRQRVSPHDAPCAGDCRRGARQAHMHHALGIVITACPTGGGDRQGLATP
ncbi:hypothetical protein D3C71_1604700 [compost metagenome]